MKEKSKKTIVILLFTLIISLAVNIFITSMNNTLKNEVEDLKNRVDNLKYELGIGLSVYEKAERALQESKHALLKETVALAVSQIYVQKYNPGMSNSNVAVTTSNLMSEMREVYDDHRNLSITYMANKSYIKVTDKEVNKSVYVDTVNYKVVTAEEAGE